ncbi:60S ribosomal protein L13-like [Panonychus citri]|uniref:60S ribosomal protein L13-like n=1 Tax=Panonychus citri TaxID=50023 RepID=UPI0023075FD7|nr:60S ribosomal protein L13-like [Panonychus citri]
MGKFRNNVVPNVHFHKDWQKYIKTWFNQPARKARRARTRLTKSKPNSLKPVVSCPTMRYNIKKRLGRGFSITELKAVGMSVGYARSIGISVDPRRKNKSNESVESNIHRLKVYKNRLQIVSRPGKKNKKPAGAPEVDKLTTTIRGKIMPLKAKRITITRRVVDKRMAKFKPFQLTRMARKKERLVGYREKKAKEAAESLDGPGKK